MKHLKILSVLVVAALMLCSLVLSVYAEGSAQSVADSGESFVDSDVIVEQAPPDYSIWVFLVIGLAVGGLVLYVLFKPKKD